jgi:SAM-dependent MidA family methyltransferase
VTLRRLIRDEIRTGGPMRFDRFMDIALYHPEHGYYTSGATRVGWGGDFVTAPEIDPAYGELWARAFEQMWEACGRPESFHIVEIGPGEGRFAAAVLGSMSAQQHDVFHYHAVERSGAAGDRQTARLRAFKNVHRHDSLERVPRLDNGCIFANEVVDNMPVRLVERRTRQIRELLVEAAGESFEFVLDAGASPELAGFFAALGCELPEGHRAEVPAAAIRFVKRAAARLRRGAIVIVDYGDHASNLVSRPAGTLLCYSPSGVDDRPLEDPGAKDITVHANWSALSSALEAGGLRVVGPLPQADVLRSLGIAGVAAELRERSHSGSAPEVLRALSRRGAITALVDEGGLGGLGVLLGFAGCDPPEFATGTGPRGGRSP